MNSAQPIRTPEELEHFKEYYQLVKPRPRNYLLIVLGLNTALRISDILELRWGNVYDFIQGHYRDRIIKTAADSCQLSGSISCHSLRKTFGYYAWQQGVSPALLMNVYNHSSYEVTKRYLGIEQDDRDNLFRSIRL